MSAPVNEDVLWDNTVSVENTVPLNNTVSVDEVVLLDEQGTPIGTAAKSEVHGTDTPLHLAFSCYVSNESGDILVTRRSLHKTAWPGVWSNSFCGHPRPGEPLTAAVHRRAAEELGLVLSSVEMALPDFRYRATDASGIVENEVCPVFLAHTAAQPAPNPEEVMDHAWVHPLRLGQAVQLAPWAFSPWLVLQAPLLPLLAGVSVPDVCADVAQ